MSTFNEKYAPIYRKVFDYHKKHYENIDWNAASNEACAIFKEPFEIALASAVYAEIGKCNEKS